MAAVWFWAVGFVLMLACIVVKNYRMYRIFKDLKKLKDSEDGSSFLRDLVQNEMKNSNTEKTEDKAKEVKKASDFLAEDQTDFLLAEEKKTGTLGFQYYVDYFLLCGSKFKVRVSPTVAPYGLSRMELSVKL